MFSLLVSARLANYQNRESQILGLRFATGLNGNNLDQSTSIEFYLDENSAMQ